MNAFLEIYSLSRMAVHIGKNSLYYNLQCTLLIAKGFWFLSAFWFSKLCTQQYIFELQDIKNWSFYTSFSSFIDISTLSKNVNNVDMFKFFGFQLTWSAIITLVTTRRFVIQWKHAGSYVGQRWPVHGNISFVSLQQTRLPASRFLWTVRPDCTSLLEKFRNIGSCEYQLLV